MKVHHHAPSSASKHSHSIPSTPKPHTHLSEIFQNTRSLSNEDFGAHTHQKIQTIDQLIEFFGISRKRLDDPATQLDIGLKFLNGAFPVQADDEQACIWITRSAEGNFPRAQYILGASYTYGTFTNQNPILAFIWLRKAADNGVSGARNMLEYIKNT